MRERIEEVLKEIRSILKPDGVDIKLMNVSEDGIVQVHFEGACENCSHSMLTLKQGLERLVKEEIPEVQKVIAV